jgi:hypothetical protein
VGIGGWSSARCVTLFTDGRTIIPQRPRETVASDPSTLPGEVLPAVAAGDPSLSQRRLIFGGSSAV